MASNKRHRSSTDRTFARSSNTPVDDAIEAVLNGSGTARSASEVERMNLSDGLRMEQQINAEDRVLCEISSTHNIPPEMAKHLPELRKFETVIVCDDSGSMNTTVDGTDHTRWDELREIVKIVLAICVKYDSNGVDIHFLNRGKFRNVKDPLVVDHAFATPPDGYTPLVPVLKKIFESDLARRGRDKKLLVFVATDGEPTDENGDRVVDELERLMRETRNHETTYVSFLLCTDDPTSVGYLNGWDRTMQHVDVTDDYETEKRKVLEHSGNNYPFSRGDYIVKALIGAIVREIDISNEPHPH